MKKHRLAKSASQILPLTENMAFPRLWIIDDDPTVTFYIDRMIKVRHLACTVTIFNSANASLEFLRENLLYPEHLPDVILLDIQMPVIDGWSFLEKFEILESNLKKEVIIYLMSSSADPRDLNKAKQIAAVKDYIVKPLTVEKLQEISASF